MKKSIFSSMKILVSILCFTLVFAMFLSSCKKDDVEEDLVGNWAKVSDFEGIPRADAVAFSIGNKGYVGTGFDGSDRLNDFWEYDPDLDFWQQKADFPGIGRNGAVGFGTSSNGYIGLGYDGLDKLKDFYQYNPELNTWTAVAEFGGSARYGAVSFCINNIGYVGTGYDGNTLKDFWKYDPSVNSWTQILSIGGSKRRDATAFVIDNIAYVVTGVNNGSYVSDFWAYNPVNGSWDEMREIDNISDDEYDDSYDFKGIYGTGFNIGSKGYLACTGQGAVSNTVWEYDPLVDLWEEKYGLEGTARIDPVSFTLNGRGFVATGRNGSYYFDDIWELHPDDENNEYD